MAIALDDLIRRYQDLVKARRRSPELSLTAARPGDELAQIEARAPRPISGTTRPKRRRSFSAGAESSEEVELRSALEAKSTTSAC